MNHFLSFFPHFKGKGRLAKFMLGNKLKQLKNVEVQGKFGCTYYLPNIIENVGFEIFINGIYEPETIILINNLIPENGHFLDLGANIGSIVIPLCKQRADIKAIAVEAAPWIFEYLSKNVESNQLQNVLLLNNALLDKDGYEIDFFAPLDKFGKGSLSPVFTKISEKVKTRTIDSIIHEFSFKNADLIKIDVEGYEYFVFKGAEKLLKSSSAPYIVFEFVDWAESIVEGIEVGYAQELLLSFGYKLFILNGNAVTKIDKHLHVGSYNLLAVPPNKMHSIPTKLNMHLKLE